MVRWPAELYIAWRPCGKLVHTAEVVADLDSGSRWRDQRFLFHDCSGRLRAGLSACTSFAAWLTPPTLDEPLALFGSSYAELSGLKFR